MIRNLSWGRRWPVTVVSKSDSINPVRLPTRALKTEAAQRAFELSLAALGQDIGLSLFDEVDGGSVVVERDDLGTRVNLDLLIAAVSSSPEE